MNDSPKSVDAARLRPHLRPGGNTPTISRSSNVHTPITTHTHTTTVSTAAGDPRKLRGIPVQAKGVGSTSPHTNPEQEATRGPREATDVSTFMLHANARRRNVA